MKRFAFLALLAASPIVTSTVAAQAGSVAVSADQYLTRRSEMGNFSGAVLIAKGDSVLLRKGYGFADLEKRIPYTPETQHYIASISKMFTSAAALKLRNEGKLDLGKSVCRYVEECPRAWEPVTVDHLIHHTSGIPDYESELELASDEYMQYMRQPKSSERIITAARAKPLDFSPGAKFEYSNTGYILLSYIVQKAAGMPFAEFVRKKLLAPAGMAATGSMGVSPGPTRLAVGYTYGDIGWEKMLGGVAYGDGHMRRYTGINLSPPAGDGFLYSTLDDMLKWSRALDGLGGPLTSAERKTMMTPGLGRYGFGLFVDSAFNRSRLRHTGSLPGYVSDFIKFPDDSVTIVIFSNIDRGRMSSVQRDLSAMVLGEPWDMPVNGKVVTLTPAQLQRLTGEYRMANGGELTVRVDDLLIAELKGRYTAGLIPLSPTEFYMPLGDGRAIFKVGPDGRATEVNMRYSGIDRIARRVSEK